MGVLAKSLLALAVLAFVFIVADVFTPLWIGVLIVVVIIFSALDNLYGSTKEEQNGQRH